MPTAPGGEHFDIHASVVFQLGESLISDSVQALMELVKNSYDADASYCKVTISTDVESSAQSPFKGAVGLITVEDDGTGMTLEDIRRGWLTISNSGKREFKKKKLTTNKGRTPLGDKGLGRLGTQRLGYNLEMFTRPKNSDSEHHVWFSWKDFLGQQKLGEVDVHYQERPPEISHGTKLIISELRELPLWKGDAVKELESNLSQMISPYREVRDFLVIATIDGKKLELLEIGDKLRQAAQLRYRLDFDGEVFKIQGKAKLSYIKPEKNPDRDLFISLVENDNGDSFFKFLLSTKDVPPFSFRRASDDGWFVEYGQIREFTDFPETDLIDGQPANPGPFHGEIDYFNLGADASAEQTVFSRISEYRELVSKLSGIKVFRDGFGIRVGSDWLNLGKQWTKGGSYYTLKPHNTLGFIAISARDNPQLEETTDREGFKTSPHYNNFLDLLTSFVKFSAQAQEFLRRGWVEFRNANQRLAANVGLDTSPESLSEVIHEGLSRAANYKSSLDHLSKRLHKSASTSIAAITKLTNGGVLSHETMDMVTGELSELKNEVEEAEKIIAEVEKYLDHLEKLESVGTVLTQQIESLRERIQQVHEVIGLGITAEALSHEINNVISQLAQRNQQLSRYMKANNIRDLKILSFAEYVKTSTDALRRQMLFLAPSLRYVRETRDVIDMEQFISEVFKHYTTYFASQPIGVIPKVEKGKMFRVSINKGKLIQILDNLFLNSEYWLKEDVRAGRIAHGNITIEAVRPFVRVSDNGRGVDPSIEDAVFQPFISAKGKGKGRGLGLYIVQQMLDAEDCTIRLLPDRNKYGRMYCFEIDLTGCWLTNAEVMEVIEKLFSAAGVQQVISIDDMYAEEAPVEEAIAAYQALEPAEPGVCAAVFGEKADIDFTSDSAVVREHIQTFWKSITLPEQREILQELRSKLNQEDDIDQGAKTSLAEFFGRYSFAALSQRRWATEKEQIFTAGKPLTLLLVDEDFSKESGGGRNDGLKIIKEVFARADSKIFLCGLLSHGYLTDDIHREWTELCEREALEKSRFVLIPKKLLDEGAEGLITFLRLIKLAILNGPAQELKQLAAKTLASAQQEATKQLDEIDIYDFDQIVFRSSEAEGIWEPDTLFRVYGLFHRDHTRRIAKVDAELHKLAKGIRTVSQVPTHSPTAPSYNTWKVQRMELYEDGEYLNPYCLPIDLGDIFEKSGDTSKQYILLSQSCDLMVRSNGERHSAITEGMLAEIVKGDPDLRTHAELQYFDSTHTASYFVSFKKVFAIRLFVLDFCSLNVDGQSKFKLGMAAPGFLIPAWQARSVILAKWAEKAINKYSDLIKKGIDHASATALVAKCSNEDKVKGQIDPGQKTLTYPIARIARLRQPRAAALLARYANFVAREAFDHDFGNPPEQVEQAIGKPGS